MSLRLQNVSKMVNGAVHIHPLNLELKRGTMNVLLGPTSAGKTSLMRLMAGLDKPDTGQIYWEDSDVTGARVPTRDVAMVYSPFVNYPAMSVYDNIASPLKIQKKPRGEIDAKVREMADLLKLTPLLDRRPAEISGGQQQRCAIARALAKDVGLVLMDEPLANLDYKLREELRVEIPRLFTASGAIFVYATTEPEEALLLGGNTASLWEGQITQFGPAMDVYRQPVDERTARNYSDPPMNFAPVSKVGSALHFPGGRSTPVAASNAHLPDGSYRAGFRAHHIEVGADSVGKAVFEAKVVVTELTGSDTYLHVEAVGERWTALVQGPQSFAVGEVLQVCLDPLNAFLFDADGKAVPTRLAETAKASA